MTTFKISDGNDAELVVCMRVTNPLKYPDNLIAPCSKCMMMCQHRPHNPKHVKIICMECVMMAKDGNEIIDALVTPETVREVQDYMRRKQN